MATVNDMFGTQHIGKQGGTYEPQRQNNILLFVDAADIGDGGDELTLSLESFPLPKTAVGVVEQNFLNRVIKLAGKATQENMAIVFKDFIDNDTLKILKTWSYQVHNPETGQTGLAREYKKRARVVEYAPDGSIKRETKIEGMWPSNFDDGDADMTSEDTKKVTVTFEIDKSYPAKESRNYPSAAGAGAASIA